MLGQNLGHSRLGEMFVYDKLVSFVNYFGVKCDYSQAMMAFITTKGPKWMLMSIT